MNINNLSIGQKLGLGFSTVIGLIVLIGINVYISSSKVKNENQKQLVMCNLLVNTSEMENNVMEYYKTGDISYIEKNRAVFSKANENMANLSTLIASKNNSFTANLNNQVKILEQTVDPLIETDKTMQNSRKRLDEMSDRALSIAAKVMGGEVSTGVHQFLKLRILEKNYMLWKDASTLQKWEREIDDNIVLANKLRLNEIETALNGYKESYLTYLDASKKLETIKNEAISSSSEIKILLEKELKQSSDSINKKTVNGQTIIILVVIFVILIGSIISYIITKNIATTISKSVDMATEIANGNLIIATDNIFRDRKDEIGKLSNAVDTMTSKLKEVISTLKASANNIASASTELTTTSQQVSQGATEQASSAEEVGASMEQMVANIQNNTDNARQAEAIAWESVEGIKKGYDSTSVAVQSMKQIAEKVSIIGDIAFQTNILALNAAVEAARAGEHGRGFAVVASEVRKLAERSRVAAEEIDRITKNGVRVAEESGKLLEDIVPEIERTARLVQEIAAASLEQNSGADQVNSAIQQLNLVTQQNAAASEGMASNAEQLNGQAQHLLSIISYFKVEAIEYMSKKTQIIPSKLIQESVKERLSTNPKKGISLKINVPEDDSYTKY